MGGIRDEDVHDGVKKKSKKRKKEESITSREGIGNMQVCDEGYENMRTEFLGNANASTGADFDENQSTNEVAEKLEPIEEKKRKKKKKKDDLGAGENCEGGGSERKEKSVGSKNLGHTNVGHTVFVENQTDNEINEKVVSMDHKKRKKNSRKKRKKDDIEAGSFDKEFVKDIHALPDSNGDNNGGGGTKNKEKPVGSTPKKKLKKVTFSGHDEYFPLPENSSNGKNKLEDGSKGNRSPDDGLIRGKRFTKEEDELVGKAVLDYIEEHQLGENGLEMVLKCKSYPAVKNCWKEIGKALPHRPYMSIYYRAHILFERSETRKWAPEELELVRKFHEKHGADWRTLADELGKHRFHVKDAWRRIKLPNRKRGDWSQDEYQSLFNLVNMDLSMRAFQEKKLKHGMLQDNISWEAISEKLSTRTNAMCCQKWYHQLSSPLVGEGRWANTDDYRLLMSLSDLDASCEEDVDWDGLIEHRSGDVCRERWTQMVRHIGQYGTKPFGEQVEILSHRYCPDLLEAREAYDSKPDVD